MDQVMALEHGGDDFITKPFQPEIVLAKIKSQLRRAYGEYAGDSKERIIELHGLKLYVERLELVFNDHLIPVSRNEAKIIELLLKRHPRVAGREDLIVELRSEERR